MTLLLLLPLLLGVLLPTLRSLLYVVRGEDRWPNFFAIIGDLSALFFLPWMFVFLLDGGLQSSSYFVYPCYLLLLALIVISILAYCINEFATINLTRPGLRATFDILLFLGAGLALITGIHIGYGSGLIINIPIASIFLLALHKSYRSNRDLIQSSMAGVKYGRPEILDDPGIFAEEEASTISLSPFWAQIFELHWLQYLSLLVCGAIGVVVLASLIGMLVGLPFNCMITTFTESYGGYFSPGL